MKMRKCPGHADCVILNDVHTDRSKVGQYIDEVVDKDARERTTELATRLDKRFNELDRAIETDYAKQRDATAAVAADLARLKGESRKDISAIKLDLAGMNERVAKVKEDAYGASRARASEAVTPAALAKVSARISELVDAYTKLSERLDREELAREAGDRA